MCTKEQSMDRDYEFFSTGICGGCAVCQQEHGMGKEELSEAASVGEIFSEPEFSWSSCEWCGSTLGGDRECAHAVNKQTGEIEHFMVCVDCVMNH